jgi:alpha-L-fucosidase 2
MKHFFPLLLFLGLASACTPSPEKALKLHYNQPAGFFEEALPLGNGTLGALVYGGPDTDRISLNDISLWTGEPDKGPDHPDYGLVSTLTPWDEISSWLPKVREALDREDYPKADELQRKLQGHNSEMYQPLGQLEIAYPEGEITDYYRELDLATAKATVRYKRNGKAFQAEYFVSAPDSVVVIKLSSEAPIEASIRLSSALPHQTKADNNALVSDGYAAWHVLQEGKTVKFYDPNRGIHYRTVVTCPQAQVRDSTLQISGVKEALLVVANHTSYNGFDKDPVKEGREYKEASFRDAQAAAQKGWSRLQKDHLKDYQALFARVSLDLGTTAEEIAALPTDQQLMRYADGETNPELEALYFQFGRYLLIACSRTEGIPANLQGLWNESMDPPWRCNYTTNINLEENYWAAEAAALPEMHQVLLGFVHNLSQTGARTAQAFYGVEEGWCQAHNSDPWAMTNPVGLGTGDPCWANWNTGGAWLSTHIWEHWLFTRNRQDLERDYPTLKGAAQFCLNILVEKDGELITSPSTSPENHYHNPDGYRGRTVYGATADLAIIRECLTDALGAAKELGDNDFAAQLEAVLPRLRGYHIGQNGALQEWYHDWADWDPQHRHQSHLVGVYPGHQITAGTHLADAALRTLEIRGFETTGWSCGWRVNLYARLGDGENAYKMYRRLLRYVSPDKYQGTDYRSGGGTYPNLWDAHSPFQIDGNFGGCAGVIEMLVHSTPEEVIPLPALPKAWPSGHIRGIRTRTGQTVDLTWENGKVKKLITK